MREAEEGNELANDSVIHATAIVEFGAEIGPNAVIGAGCKIAAGAKILDSCVMEGSVIEKGCLIRHSIIGQNNNIKSYSRVEQTTTAKKVVLKEMTLLVDCKVGPFRTIGGKGDKEIFL